MNNVLPLRITPPDEARVWDVFTRAQTTGCHLVHDGRSIYVTPMVLPGERVIAVREHHHIERVAA